ncbi:hypothetical protein A2690_02855 [Candidatus Roizmanbacteria bacterium RIFCSPHIGHO2_01_FULL_39_12b]|uniref:Type II toxin-antitoxin system mRNA interferase toxin, RelE/StbE family n=1 Tax=Candidatus Roizmanbacteria bacterium RIFCSPHIGHO2_01_FULL_39_12b TaxID=1802030 RepID=A0A1F7GBL0_9BACT|nr:MAG: hypothetical protein A2690_02855 [Candidatus Roizmanbacteria bacterium RIFCSPHIGHO2_01_FULL_39_12b]
MQINFSKAFGKMYEKAPQKIQTAFDKRFDLFKQDPRNLLLHNHKLIGAHQGKRSINITGDWRAVYKESEDNTIVFVHLGIHSQLYE